MSNNFNSISKIYDLLGFLVFKNTLKKSQLHFMNAIPANSRILIVGGGTGWYLEELLKNTALKKVVYVEASSKMMKLSQERIAEIHHKTELKFINAPVENISMDEKFDVIVTNYFLDLFKENRLLSITGQLYSFLDSQGIWMVTDFKVSERFFHKIWQKALLKTMYLFFRYTSGIEAKSLPDFGSVFSHLKLKEISSKEFFSGMMRAVVYRKD